MKLPTGSRKSTLEVRYKLRDLFGSGGGLYAIYLNGRIEAKEQASSTQSTLIGIITLIRLSRSECGYEKRKETIVAPGAYDGR